MTKPNQPPTHQTKRKAPSADELLATQFLQDRLSLYKKKALWAYGADVLSVLFLVVLAYFLAQLFGQLVYNQLQEQPNDSAVLRSFVVYIGMGLLARMALLYVREQILLRISVQMSTDVRKEALQAVGNMGPARRQLGADGAIASHILKESDELGGYVRFYVQKLTTQTTPLIIVLAVATQSWQSALILLVTVPLVVFFMIVIGSKTAQKSRKQMDAMAQMGGRFLDWLRGMNTLVRLLAVDIAQKDIQRASDEYQKRTMDVLKIAFLNSTVLEFFSAICIALVAVYLGFGLMGLLPWQMGVVIVPYWAALFVLFLVPEFYAPLRRLAGEYHAKSAGLAAAKVLAPMMQNVPTHTSAPAIQDTSIVLQDVCVQSGERVRLSGVSLSVLPTQKWALVGASGSGKSTIFEVLLGVCAYTGSAQIGGAEIHLTNMRALYHRIGYLSQTPALLPMSILENLRLAKPNASEDECVAVLHKVGLAALCTQKQGIHTQLTERGGGLSGGQAQRLAIAQLLLQDADIWLLDEPTEHLDAQTKTQIHELLQTVGKNKTILWATHDQPVSWLDGVYQLRVQEENHD